MSKPLKLFNTEEENSPNQTEKKKPKKKVQLTIDVEPIQTEQKNEKHYEM
jgi:hypothetical protein